jgi:UDP-glucose 4-epimerase
LPIRIVITGSSGYLAQQLIARLGADPGVEFILGLDIRPPAPVEKRPAVNCPASFLQFDLTTHWIGLRDLFRAHAINTALHLAWQFNPIHDLGRHRQVDLEGAQHFFCAAAVAALRRVIYTSSTTAYVNPVNPSEPPYLSEDSPVSGTPRYLYSKHKAEVDLMAQEFAAQHPEMQVLILRPCIVLGPHTRNIVSEMVRWPWQSFPWMFQVRGADPPMQFVFEEDVAEVLFRAVKSETRGIFNVAGDGVVRYTELIRAVGKKSLPLPAALLYRLAAAMWALRLAPFPAGMLDMIRYPWVADNARLKNAFGYAPRLTSRQALDSFIASRLPSKHAR